MKHSKVLAIIFGVISALGIYSSVALFVTGAVDGNQGGQAFLGLFLAEAVVIYALCVHTLITQR